MSILEKIQTELAAITPQQIDRVLACLPPIEDGEVFVKVIESAEARRLWALSAEYDRQGAQLVVSALSAPDRPAAMVLRRQSNVTEALASIVRDMAWVEMRLETDVVTGSIALRAGFTLVSCPKDDSKTEESVIAGVAPMTPALALALKAMLESLKPITEEAPPKERKPS